MVEPLRTCRECGKQVFSIEDLKIFVNSSRCKYGKVNLCKECFNKIRVEKRKNPEVKWHGKIYQPTLKPLDLSNVEDIELAYWAGAIDSDGMIGIYEQKREKMKSIYPNIHSYFCLIIGFTNISKHLVSDFRKLVNEKGYYCNDTRSNRVIYTYNFSGYRAYSVIKALLPYLRLKRKQALLGIEYWENKKIGVGRRLTKEELEKREKYWLEMRKLNSSGGELAEW